MSDLAKLLMLAYVNEPCHICGRMIEESDLETLKWAGGSEKYPGSRSMHLRCYEGFVDMYWVVSDKGIVVTRTGNGQE